MAIQAIWWAQDTACSVGAPVPNDVVRACLRESVSEFCTGRTLYTTTLDSLDNDTRRGTAAVANGRAAVLASLELMQHGCDDSRAGATKSVAESDGATARVDVVDA